MPRPPDRQPTHPCGRRDPPLSLSPAPRITLACSDHGFQLGEFNIPMDKRHVFDWDTRVHLLARGPGIKHGSKWAQPATQVDLAPTFLGIAGLAAPSQMDGKSLLPLLVDTEDTSLVAEVSASTLGHLKALGGSSKAYTKGWRDLVFIEYYWVK